MPYKDKLSISLNQKKHRIMIRRNLLEYLSDKGCIDCEENIPE